MISVIFIGSRSSVFVTRSADALVQHGINVAIVEPLPEFARHNNSSIFRIFFSLKKVFRLIRELRVLPPADAIMIHYLGADLALTAFVARIYCNRTIGMAYGSDVLRRNRRLDMIFGLGLGRLTEIAATNVNVVEEIVASFPYLRRSNVRVLRFGLPVFEEIIALSGNKEKIALFRRELNVNPNETIVSLGYNSSPGQRQLELVEFFRAHADQLRHVRFLVPVQYGSAEVRGSIIKVCKAHNSELSREAFIPISEFYDQAKSAQLRMATDVLINHSVSDAFSGTVQEVLYSGNCVMADRHLPYESMPGSKFGMFMYDRLEEMLPELDKDALAARARQAKLHMEATQHELNSVSSWGEVIDDWKRIIVG